MELLEYLTREQPNSPWFDDPTTPEREDRDVILKRSFGQAVASLKKDFGPDIERWRWKNINRLEISSWLGQKELGRTGTSAGHGLYCQPR